MKRLSSVNPYTITMKFLELKRKYDGQAHVQLSSGFLVRVGFYGYEEERRSKMADINWSFLGIFFK